MLPTKIFDIFNLFRQRPIDFYTYLIVLVFIYLRI